ncbi:MAG: aromatic ring-hydroxylating dioxygenase subunit alpha [Spirochaetota bacterium]
MIRNQWYAVLDSRELGTTPLGCIRMGERMIFWRDASGSPLCHVDRCAHRGASFTLGKVLCEGEHRLMCPFHGLEYDSTGVCTKIPANGASAPVPPGFKLRSYPARQAHGFIWIFWAEEGCTPTGEPRWFDDLPDSMIGPSVADPWANHYSRAIENQLDMAHLPFVHYNTIGRGNRTVVDGPGIMMRDGSMFVYVYNRLDDGSPRRSSEEVPVPRTDMPFKLEFIFPNVWENFISEKLRIIAAFVPVDEGNTVMYLRFCQSFMKVPLLKNFVEWMGNRANIVVAHQDRRIVETQIPRGDGMGAGELLIPGDRALMEYRKMRVEAMKGLKGE